MGLVLGVELSVLGALGLLPAVPLDSQLSEECDRRARVIICILVHLYVSRASPQSTEREKFTACACEFLRAPMHL